MNRFIHALAVVTSILDPVLGASLSYAKQSPNPLNSAGSTYTRSYVAVPRPLKTGVSLPTHAAVGTYWTVPNQNAYGTYSSAGRYDTGLTDAMLDMTLGEYQIGFYEKDGQWYYGPYYQPGLGELVMHGSMQPQPWTATPVGNFGWDPFRGVASGITEADKSAANAWYSGWRWDPTSDYVTKMRLPSGQLKIPNFINEAGKSAANAWYSAWNGVRPQLFNSQMPNLTRPLGQLSQGIASTTANFGGGLIRNVVNGGNRIGNFVAPLFSGQNTRAVMDNLSSAANDGGRVLRGGAEMVQQIASVLPNPDQVANCIGGVCNVASSVMDFLSNF